MSKRIFLDIETIPPCESSRQLITSGEVQKLGRYTGESSDPDAICSDEEFLRLSLHAEYGRVLSIGIILEEDGEVKQSGVFGRDRLSRKFHLDEARTLRGFWSLLKDFRPSKDLIIGHNLMEFDLPFLNKRSRILGVRPSVNLKFVRYSSQPIYDTMKEWSCWAWVPGVKLTLLAKLLNVGINKPEDLDGSQIYEALRAGRDEEIAQYCLRDVEIARAIFYRMNYEDAPPLVTVEDQGSTYPFVPDKLSPEMMLAQ